MPHANAKCVAQLFAAVSHDSLLHHEVKHGRTNRLNATESLGIDHTKVLTAPGDRPIRLVDKAGKPVAELFA
jgi:hypothetical protein